MRVLIITQAIPSFQCALFKICPVTPALPSQVLYYLVGEIYVCCTLVQSCVVNSSMRTCFDRLSLDDLEVNSHRGLSTGLLWCVLWKFTFYLPLTGTGESLMQCSIYSLFWIMSALTWLWRWLYNRLPAGSHRLKLHSINVCCLSAKTKMCPHRLCNTHCNPVLGRLHCDKWDNEKIPARIRRRKHSSNSDVPHMVKGGWKCEGYYLKQIVIIWLWNRLKCTLMSL